MKRGDRVEVTVKCSPSPGVAAFMHEGRRGFITGDATEHIGWSVRLDGDGRYLREFDTRELRVLDLVERLAELDT